MAIHVVLTSIPPRQALKPLPLSLHKGRCAGRCMHLKILKTWPFWSKCGSHTSRCFKRHATKNTCHPGPRGKSENRPPCPVAQSGPDCRAPGPGRGSRAPTGRRWSGPRPRPADDGRSGVGTVGPRVSGPGRGSRAPTGRRQSGPDSTAAALT